MKEKQSNKITVKLSVTMMKKLKYLAHTNDMEYGELLMDLIEENIERRIFKKNKTMPNHLFTKNGYIHPDKDNQYNEVYR